VIQIVALGRASDPKGEKMYDDMPSKENILNLQKRGHTFHCAMRILAGDGECECGKRI